MFQLLILVVLFCVLGVVLVKYFKQEAKFKQMISQKFYIEKDVINELSNKMVLESYSKDHVEKNTILTKDIEHLSSESIHNVAHDDLNLLQNFHLNNNIQQKLNLEKNIEKLEIPEDSVEAIFRKYDSYTFDQEQSTSSELVAIIDIFFDAPIKVTTVPNIAQYTDKDYQVFILDKKDIWQKYQVNKKISCTGIKFIIDLIDSRGVSNIMQIDNIYKQLHQFTIDNNGYIRLNDYKNNLMSIKEKLSHISSMQWDIVFYLIAQTPIVTKKWVNVCTENSLKNIKGKLAAYKDDQTLFVLSDINDQALEIGRSYNILKVSCALHLQIDPVHSLDALFDFYETIVNKLDVRLLNANKDLFEQDEYQKLLDRVHSYIAIAAQHKILTGSSLVKKYYSN